MGLGKVRDERHEAERGVHPVHRQQLALAGIPVSIQRSFRVGNSTIRPPTRRETMGSSLPPRVRKGGRSLGCWCCVHSRRHWRRRTCENRGDVIIRPPTARRYRMSVQPARWRELGNARGVRAPLLEKTTEDTKRVPGQRRAERAERLQEI
eukprot:1082359-Prorocentrum_minimum.AAC.1